MERKLPRFAVQDGVGRPWAGVARLADAARIDEPERPRGEAERAADVSPDALGADLDRARSMGVAGTADLEVGVEAAQLERHFVKRLGAPHAPHRVSEHRM